MKLRHLDLTEAGLPVATSTTSKYATDPIPSSARSGELANYRQSVPSAKFSVCMGRRLIFSETLISHKRVVLVGRRVFLLPCATR